MANPFDATVKGVLDYVPELHLDDVEDAPMVETFLGVTSPIVAGAIGPRLRALTALNRPEATAAVTEAEEAARGIVQMGAASLVQDSRYPELASSRNTDQSWGAALWARFEAAITALGASLDAELERLGVDASVDVANDLPAVSAPPTTFHDAMRF